MSRAIRSCRPIFSHKHRNAAATVVAALACLMLATSEARAQITIDNFSPDAASPYYHTNGSGNAATAYEVSALNVNPYTANEVSTGAIGGTRSMELQVNGTPNPTSLALQVGYVANDHADELNVGTNGTAPGVVTLNYVLAGVDLSGAGANKDFDFQMAPNDQAGMSLAVTLTSGTGVSAVTSTASATVPLLSSSTDIQIPLSSFNASGFHITDVTKISVALNQSSALKNVDYSLQGITVAPVPEPATFLTAAIGSLLCGGYLLRRRRIHSASQTLALA